MCGGKLSKLLPSPRFLCTSAVVTSEGKGVLKWKDSLSLKMQWLQMSYECFVWATPSYILEFHKCFNHQVSETMGQYLDREIGETHSSYSVIYLWTCCICLLYQEIALKTGRSLSPHFYSCWVNCFLVTYTSYLFARCWRISVSPDPVFFSSQEKWHDSTVCLVTKYCRN